MTQVRAYALGTSTTLESNKSHLTIPFPGYTEREGLWLALRPLSRRWRLGDGFACGITSQGALNNRVVNPKIRGA